MQALKLPSLYDIEFIRALMQVELELLRQLAEAERKPRAPDANR
jgi:hypothetical protein